MKIDPYLSHFTKLSSKWIKDLNIRLDTLNLVEKKVWNRLKVISMGKGFLNRAPITQAF